MSKQCDKFVKFRLYPATMKLLADFLAKQKVKPAATSVVNDAVVKGLKVLSR